MKEQEKINTIKFNLRKVLEQVDDEVTADTPFEEYPKRFSQISGGKESGDWSKTIKVTNNSAGQIQINCMTPEGLMPFSIGINQTKNIPMGPGFDGSETDKDQIFYIFLSVKHWGTINSSSTNCEVFETSAVYNRPGNNKGLFAYVSVANENLENAEIIFS